MLNKRDNPQLFHYIAEEVSKFDSSVNSWLAVSLTDEQLAKVSRLNINPLLSPGTNVTSLAGIEKLPNLEHLSIQGLSPTKYFSRIDAIKRRSSFSKAENENDIKDCATMFESCQIKPEDTQYIKQLPKLKTLNLSNQRNITELDVSQNPNLYNVNCSGATNLSKISGLQKLDCFNGKEPNSIDDMDFDFTECPMLCDIGNADQLFEQAYKHLTVFSPKLHFHTATYAKLLLQSRETGSKFSQILEEQETGAAFQLTEWVESGLNSFRSSHNARQMRIVSNRVSDIIRTVCADNPSSDLEKLSRWYRWIADNCSYDYKGLKLEGERKGSLLNQERNSNNMRSSFHTLWNKTGVCAGVANLFNYGAALMNFSTLPVYCRTKPLEAGENPLTVIPDHEASELFCKNGDPLFFDPTWEMGKETSRYFALNKEEFSRTHGLTIENKNDKENTLSYQAALSQMGCLSTQTPVKKIDSAVEHNR